MGRRLSIGVLVALALLAAPATCAAAIDRPAELAAVGSPSLRGEWVASVIYPTAARRAPRFSSRRLAMVPAVSRWGAPEELLVLGKRSEPDGRTWLRVRLDVRPNGSSVWLDGQDTLVHYDRWRISVYLAKRRLRVYRDGHLISVMKVVVGKRSTPTPGGLFAVAGKLHQPNSKDFEGSWVLPLTAHSDVLHRFDGGDGQVALHGRGGASLADPLGSARSHGCIRLDNHAIDWLARHVPVGTPVRVLG